MESSYKFITTIELGRLARWLRVLGFDCAFFDPSTLRQAQGRSERSRRTTDSGPPGENPGGGRARQRDIVIESLRQGRIILTRSSRLSSFSGIRMVRVESDFVREQLAQVIKSLRLKIDRSRMFSRCVMCNTPTETVEKASVEGNVPAHVYKVQEEFTRCPGCGKIYWKGGHWELAERFLKDVPER